MIPPRAPRPAPYNPGLQGVGRVPEALLNSALTRPRATLFWEDPFVVARDEGIPVVGADSRNELYIVYPNGETFYHSAWVASLISAGIWSGDPPHRYGLGRVGQWTWRMARDDSQEEAVVHMQRQLP